jgi:hypothetical protein
MNFSEALALLKIGYKLYRYGWNGENLYVYITVTSNVLSNEQLDNDMIINPVFYICDENKKTVNAWVVSQSDLLADDWNILKNKKENLDEICFS